MNSASQIKALEAELRRAVETGNRDSLESVLLTNKEASESLLNELLFVCIKNYRASEQYQDCLSLLIRHKANPNTQQHKETPLGLACRYGYGTVVKRLIEGGAKIQPSSTKLHPLQILLMGRQQQYDILECLLNASPDLANLELTEGLPIVIAIKREHEKYCRILAKRNFNLTSLNPNDDNVIHLIMAKQFARPEKKVTFLKIFADRPALFQAKNKAKKTPLQCLNGDFLDTTFLEYFQVRPKQPKIQSGSKKKIKEDEAEAVEEPEEELSVSPYRQAAIEQAKCDLQDDPNPPESKTAKPKNIKNLLISPIANSKKNIKVTPKQQSKRIIQPPKKMATIATNGPKSSILSSSSNINKSSKKLLEETQEQPRTAKKVSKVDKSFSMSSGSSDRKIARPNEPGTATKKNQLKGKKHSAAALSNLSVVDPHQEANEIHQKSCDDSTHQETTQRSSSEQILSMAVGIKEKPSSKLLKECLSLNKAQKQQAVTCTTGLQFVQNEAQSRLNRQQTQSQCITARSFQLNEELASFTVQEELGVDAEEHPENGLERQIESFPSCQNSTRLLSEEQFFDMISQQIMHLEAQINTSIESSQLAIESIIVHLTQTFNNFLGVRIPGAKAQLRLYGSRATGLCLPDSDIDLLLVCNVLPPNDLMDLIEASHFLQCCKCISEVKYITATSMPVMKLAYTNTFGSFRLDITFFFRGHTGEGCSNLVSRYIVSEPMLRPLVLVLKQLVKAYGLNDTYTGGIGSYSLILMVVAFLQLTEKEGEQQLISQK